MVERDGLENRCTRKRTEGSNPSPSASQDIIGGQTHYALERKLWEKKLDAL